MGARRWDGDGAVAWLSCGWGRCGGAYGGAVAAARVAGPVAGVLSWSSGCGATPSLALNRESIA